MTTPPGVPSPCTDTPPLLRIRGLTVDLLAPEGDVRAVDLDRLDVHAGEVVAVVGESGSGKSTLCRAIVGTLSPRRTQVAGSVMFDGDELLSMTERERRRVRVRMGLVPQDPLAALNPVMRVGAQVAESLRVGGGRDRRTARGEAIELLDRVGIPDPALRARSYPHELSGGLRQRVMVAISIALHPRLLVADEPTTALDATIQAQIVDLLARLRAEEGLAMLLVSHDLGVVAQVADRVLVLYAGRLAELRDATSLYDEPAHPYTQGLLGASVRLGSHRVATAIPGAPPDLSRPPSGCAFHPRCPRADDRCGTETPPPRPLNRTGAVVACHHPGSPDGI